MPFLHQDTELFISFNVQWIYFVSTLLFWYAFRYYKYDIILPNYIMRMNNEYTLLYSFTFISKTVLSVKYEMHFWSILFLIYFFSLNWIIRCLLYLFYKEFGMIHINLSDSFIRKYEMNFWSILFVIYFFSLNLFSRWLLYFLNKEFGMVFENLIFSVIIH